MRISTSMIYEQGVAGIQRKQADLLRVQQQLATGRRVVTPADDPIAAAQALQLTQADAVNSQYRVNRDAAVSRLSLTETALAGMIDVLHGIRERAVAGGNGAYTNADRASVAAEITALYEELLGLANGTDADGRYLFSGYQGATQPFLRTSTGVQFAGDDGTRLVQVGPSRQLAANISGADALMRIRTGNGVFTWAPAGPLQTSQDPANTGSGTISPVRVVDPQSLAGSNYQIVFTSSSTYDVVDITNLVTVLSAQPYGGTAATVVFDGIAVDIQGSPASGDTFALVQTSNSGTGVIGPGSVTDQSLITGHNYEINFTVLNGVTTYDVVDVSTAPETTVLAAQPYTGGSATIVFDGISLLIEGNPANGDSFTVASSTNQDLFTTVQNLISALGAGAGAPVANGIAIALTNIDRAMERLLEQRISVGMRLREIDNLNPIGEELGIQYQTARSALIDVDYAKAISDLTRDQANLEAAQQSFVRITGSSLFDYL